MNENIITAPIRESEKPAPEVVKFTRPEWLCLALGAIMAGLYLYVFSFEHLIDGIPALGTTVFVVLFYSCVFAVLGRRVKLNFGGIFSAAAALLLALSCALYGDYRARIINCFVIFALSMVSVFALSGLARRRWSEPTMLLDAVFLSARALFVNIPLPFRAMRFIKGKSVLLVLLGLLCGVTVLAAVVPLLASGDAVFSGLVEDVYGWLGSVDASWVWRIVRFFALALMCFSALYFLIKSTPPAWNRSAAEKMTFPATPVVVALVLLDAVYLIFCAIQFAYLFGGAETAAMLGGYAEYARSGFFQLVAVAAINICVVLCAAEIKTEGGGRKAVCVLGMLLIALTLVILVSAARRMGLYISVYGLSYLRALTLFAMFNIAVCLAAAGIKLLRPSFGFFRVFYVCAVASWVIFSMSNICARIADYNVDAYLDGRVEQMDAEYLTNLSSDAKPALQRLDEAMGTDWAQFGGVLEFGDNWADKGLFSIRNR
jgi:hypothetical protein